MYTSLCIVRVSYASEQKRLIIMGMRNKYVIINSTKHVLPYLNIKCLCIAYAA